jgi:hypothetical protein
MGRPRSRVLASNVETSKFVADATSRFAGRDVATMAVGHIAPTKNDGLTSIAAGSIRRFATALPLKCYCLAHRAAKRQS